MAPCYNIMLPPKYEGENCALTCGRADAAGFGGNLTHSVLLGTPASTRVVSLANVIDAAVVTNTPLTVFGRSGRGAGAGA